VNKSWLGKLVQKQNQKYRNKDLNTRDSSIDSNISIWEIIFDCPRMESFQQQDSGTLTLEEKDLILIRLKKS